MSLRLWTGAFLSMTWLWVQPARAHIDLNYPPMRGGNQKQGPCEGVAPGGDGPVTTLEPGSTLVLEVDETIAHPGHLRVMFDPDVTDGEDFPDPSYCDDVRDPDGLTVLADGVLPAQGFTCPGFHTPSERSPGGSYEIEVTLPDMECENCALQVVQVMTDEGKANPDGTWNPAGGAGLYFRCADVKLAAGGDSEEPDPDMDPSLDPDPGEEDSMPVAGGCSSSGRRASGGSWLSLLIIGAWTARRARRIGRAA